MTKSEVDNIRIDLRSLRGETKRLAWLTAELDKQVEKMEASLAKAPVKRAPRKDVPNA